MKKPVRCPLCGAKASVCQDIRTKCWHVICIYDEKIRAIQHAKRKAAIKAWNATCGDYIDE